MPPLPNAQFQAHLLDEEILPYLPYCVCLPLALLLVLLVPEAGAVSVTSLVSVALILVSKQQAAVCPVRVTCRQGEQFKSVRLNFC